MITFEKTIDNVLDYGDQHAFAIMSRVRSMILLKLQDKTMDYTKKIISNYFDCCIESHFEDLKKVSRKTLEKIGCR